MARIAVRAGQVSTRRQVNKSTGRQSGRNARTTGVPGLDRSAVISVVDEIDSIETTLAALPLLTDLARMIDHALHANQERRDEIALLGLKLIGRDVDRSIGATGVKPDDGNLMADVSMGAEAVIEALRWRLQRLSLVLSRCAESQPS